MNSTSDFQLYDNPAYRSEPRDYRDKVLVPVFDNEGDIIDREVVGYNYCIIDDAGRKLYKVSVDSFSALVYPEDVYEEIKEQLDYPNHIEF